MRIRIGLVCMGLAGVVLAGCASTPPGPGGVPMVQQPEAWRGLHLYFYHQGEIPALKQAIVEEYAPSGVNVLVLEINYNFQYQSHPELAARKGMTHEQAREIAALCRENGIRLIPQFNCFGHQSGSWGGDTLALLKKYPELDVAPEIPANNDEIYARSWNPLHPKTNEIAFALMDELVDAFQADAFHVGMDEVFLFPEEGDPYYEGQSNAEIYAKAVNDYYGHLVGERGLEMLMWGDRLLPMSEMPHNEYESSANGTAPAADMIPKDIIVCDWHYTRRREYPSVGYLLDKGFRVWPATWRSPSAAVVMLNQCEDLDSDRILGILCTTWCGTGTFSEAVLAGNPESLDPDTQPILKTFRTVSKIWSGGPLPVVEGGVIRWR